MFSIDDTDIEIVNELGQLHPHVFDGINTIMDARLHYNWTEDSIIIDLITDIKLYTYTSILSLENSYIHSNYNGLTLKDLLNISPFHAMNIRFITFRIFCESRQDYIVILKINNDINK